MVGLPCLCGFVKENPACPWAVPSVVKYVAEFQVAVPVLVPVAPELSAQLYLTLNEVPLTIVIVLPEVNVTGFPEVSVYLQFEPVSRLSVTVALISFQVFGLLTVMVPPTTQPLSTNPVSFATTL